MHKLPLEKSKKRLDTKTSFGGYVIGKATVTDQDLDASTKSHTDFDIRLVRAYVDGKILDFKYKLQLELNGKPGDYTNEKGVRIVDAWAEWQKYKFSTYVSDSSNAPSHSRIP